jgi:hypothetical protein
MENSSAAFSEKPELGQKMNFSFNKEFCRMKGIGNPAPHFNLNPYQNDPEML